MNISKASTSSTRPPSKAAASDSQRSLGKTSKSSHLNPSSLTHSKVSAAPSKSSMSSGKSTSSRKGIDSDTKGTTSAASSKVSARRKTIATSSPVHSAKTQRSGPVTDTQHAATNAVNAKKPVDSKTTKKATAKRNSSEGAALPGGEAEPPNHVSSKVSSKVLRKNTDGDKTKSQRDAAEEDVEKNALSKTSVSQGDKPGNADKGKASVDSKLPQRKMSLLRMLIKRKSLAVLNAAGGALTRRAPSKPRPQKPNTPVEVAVAGKSEAVSDARASLARLAAMNGKR